MPPRSLVARSLAQPHPTVDMALKEPLLGESDDEAKLSSWRKVIFFVTFVNYAMSHI